MILTWGKSTFPWHVETLWVPLSLPAPLMPACTVASVVSDSVTLWTVAHQAPLFVGFFRREYWSGLLCPPPGGLWDPAIKPMSLYVSCIDRQVLYH